MDKTTKLKNQQDFLRRNKSSKKMLQEQQRVLKKGLLASTPDFKEVFDEEMPMRKRKQTSLKHFQKELKKPKTKRLEIPSLY